MLSEPEYSFADVDYKAKTAHVVHNMNRVLILTGPTGVGKTSTALALARRRRPIEVINADSTQVFEGMDIGTAKHAKTVQERIPHHLFDFRKPNEPNWSVYSAHEDMWRTIRAVLSRGALPVVLGGTGYYLKWLTEGGFVNTAVDHALHDKIARTLENDATWEESLERLAAIDPVYAKTIPRKDYRRLLRALETYEATGKPLSQLPRMPVPTDVEFRGVFLTRPRLVLYRRIDARTEQMIFQGFIPEVIRLLRKYGHENLTNSFHAIGYGEAVDFLRNATDGRSLNRRAADELMTMAENISTRTRQYAHEQFTWFRRQKRYVWLDIEHLVESDICTKIEACLDAPEDKFSEMLSTNDQLTEKHLNKAEVKALREYRPKFRLLSASHHCGRVLEFVAEELRAEPIALPARTPTDSLEATSVH